MARSILLPCVWMLCHAEPAIAMQPGPGKVGFWIGTDNTEIFDGQALAVIARYGGMVVLNAPLQNRLPEYRYDEVVRRLKIAAPGVPVLAYVTPTSWFQGQSGRMTGTILKGYPDLGRLLLHDRAGNLIDPDKGKLLFGDVLNPQYRDWASGRITEALRHLPVDGIALDYFLRTPTVRHAALCKADPAFCPRHAQGVDELLSALRAKNPQKTILFNGLFGLFGGQLEDQLKLLPHADAAAIEYFGMYPEQGNIKPLPFRSGILPYLDIAERHPDKIFMFFGRSHNKYSDYAEDYLWQRYLYCAYLLGAGSNTLFKYLSLFSVPVLAGRSGGLDIYADWALALGRPTEHYQMIGGVYVRHFSGGLVLLVPQDGEGRQFHLQESFYTPEGELVSGTLALHPGQGLILLRQAPEIRGRWSADLRAIRKGWPETDASSLDVDAEDRPYLKFPATAAGTEWRHDILLDPVRALRNGAILRIRYRSADPAARLLMVTETDDDQRVQRTAVLELSVSGQPAYRPAPRIPYRLARGSGDAPYFSAGKLTADGIWRVIEVDGGRALDSAGPYRFQRWNHLRIAGAIDIGNIEIMQDRR